MINVSNVLDVRMLGLNDDVCDDPEDPDYEELLDELEGKIHRPSLIILIPVYKIKFDQQIKSDFYYMHSVSF